MKVYPQNDRLFTIPPGESRAVKFTLPPGVTPDDIESGRVKFEYALHVMCPCGLRAVERKEGNWCCPKFRWWHKWVGAKGHVYLTVALQVKREPAK